LIEGIFFHPSFAPTNLKKEKEKEGGRGAAIVSSILCVV
jgi:hypothetical protein